MNIDEPDFVELEPTLEEESEEMKAGSPAKQKQVLERKNDIRLLNEHLPDLRYNELTQKYEYGSRTNPMVFSGDDLEQLTVKLAVESGVYIPESRVKQAVKFTAKMNSYCPIKRYLTECNYRGEQYDDWDRIGEVLIGSKERIATIALQRFFIGAVARAYDPGCSMSWMPIFIGAQGCGKSQLIREMVPDNLFAEITVNIDLLMREMYRMHVSWITELPEVDNFFNSRNIENFKNLVTTRTDEVRLPYHSLPLALKRRFVLAGTSNRSEIFVDPTGNRRFLPIEVPVGFETPWRELKTFRHRIWATAMRKYDEGVGWELTSGDVATLHAYIQQFNVTDPWEELILKYIQAKEETTTSEILMNALSFTPQASSPKDSRRVASVMQQIGWRKMITTRKGRSVRVWVPVKKGKVVKTSLTDF